MCDKKSQYLKSRMPRRISEAGKRMPCVGTGMNRELVADRPFRLGGREIMNGLCETLVIVRP